MWQTILQQDELDLKADGTYRHVLGTDKLKQVDTGTWMVETLRGETVGISLDNFRFRDQHKQMKPPGVWHFEVQTEAFSGQYKLCFDPDLNSCFVKPG
jgi:hypothetical protein